MPSNIRSPQPAGRNVRIWTPDEMNKARPYPVPQVEPRHEVTRRDESVTRREEQSRPGLIRGGLPED